jgi:ribonuclease P protein component
VANKLTLGKEERLKSRKQIEMLFSDGMKFSVPAFRVHYLIDQKDKPLLQFTVGVSQKNFRKAVDRNTIKRRVREAYRLQKSGLEQIIRMQKCAVSIFILYTGKKIPEFGELMVQVNWILDKLSQDLQTGK